MSERPDPTRQAAQRLLDGFRIVASGLDHATAADVRLVAEAVMDARSADTADTEFGAIVLRRTRDGWWCTDTFAADGSRIASTSGNHSCPISTPARWTWPEEAVRLADLDIGRELATCAHCGSSIASCDTQLQASGCPMPRRSRTAFHYAKWDGTPEDPITVDEMREVAADWCDTTQLANALDAAAYKVTGLARREAALQAEVVRLREALEGLVAWENYDVEYADEATIREHDADYARARAVLKEAA